MANAAPMSKSEAVARVKAFDRLEWASSFVSIADATGDVESNELHHNQVFCIADHRQFQASEKGRQEGHSFGFALDSVARSVLEPRVQSVHISTDKWEAQKKQVYCLRILDSVRRGAQEHVKTKSISKDRIEFKNGAFIDFLACRQPRGADRAGVYLDEFAYMPDASLILKAGLACTTHGGYIRLGSTHCGTQSEFFKIVRNVQNESGNFPYQYWGRGNFPWWSCHSLCIDVERAIQDAPQMKTADRVEMFGNDRLKNVYLGYPSEEEFQEEYECIAVDESHAFFPLDLITGCVTHTEEFCEYIELAGNDSLIAAKEAIDRLSHARRNGLIRGLMYWALDVGRFTDLDEITVTSDFNNKQKLHLNISMKQMKFERKQEICEYLLDKLPINKGRVDATRGSMGVHLGEILFARYGDRAEQFEFTQESKSIIANSLKIRMQSKLLEFPQAIPKMIRQIHAIKRTTTTAGSVVYSVTDNNEHHGDKFWSLAMCCSLGDVYGVSAASYSTTVFTRERPYGSHPATQNLPKRKEVKLWTPGGFVTIR